MKKTISILLLFAMLLSLYACGGEKISDNKAVNTTENTENIENIEKIKNIEKIEIIESTESQAISLNKDNVSQYLNVRYLEDMTGRGQCLEVYPIRVGTFDNVKIRLCVSVGNGFRIIDVYDEWHRESERTGDVVFCVDGEGRYTVYLDADTHRINWGWVDASGNFIPK